MPKLRRTLALLLLLVTTVAIAAPANAATTASPTYPTRGRGAWSGTGVGGTLATTGLLPGRYYRAAAGTMSGPGYAAYRAIQAGTAVSINDYAVHRAVLAIQTELRLRGFPSSDGKPLVLDGLWGPKVDTAVKAFQAHEGLVADGLFGPVTAKALFSPLVESAAAATDPTHSSALARLMVGTITWESRWDPAAVGGATPQDLGLGQINGPAHPGMSVDDRLDPRKAVPYVAGLVDSNLVAFGYRIDEAVAAYNLGQGGARRWVAAGKPQFWPTGTTNDIHRYIDKILNPA